MSVPAWRRALTWAAGATVVTVLLVIADVDRTGRNAVNLIQAGADGPSVAVVTADFPNVELPSGPGHDGQQFYAIARDPLHPADTGDHLDRPRYRLQRILYPALAWMLHPTGGGPGLIAAMFVVGTLALLGGGVAGGLLSHRLGGPLWVAAVVPLLPGSYASLRLSTSDSLGLAMALAALALSLHGRHRTAIAAGCLAVLAKEPYLLVLAGFGLWRRDRRAIALAGVPALVAGAWWLTLHGLVDVSGPQVREFTWWLAGCRDALAAWADGDEPLAAASAGVVVVAGVAALARQRPGFPLWAPLAVQLAFLPHLSFSALVLFDNLSRIALPGMALALLTLTAPRDAERLSSDAAPGAPRRG